MPLGRSPGRRKLPLCLLQQLVCVCVSSVSCRVYLRIVSPSRGAMRNARETARGAHVPDADEPSLGCRESHNDSLELGYGHTQRGSSGRSSNNLTFFCVLTFDALRVVLRVVAAATKSVRSAKSSERLVRRKRLATTIATGTRSGPPNQPPTSHSLLSASPYPVPTAHYYHLHHSVTSARRGRH